MPLRTSRPWAVALALTVACASPRFVETAFYGDLTTLKKEIAAAQRNGTLERGGVEELAAAVARREVRSSQGTEAVQRIRETRACAGAVLPELEERSHHLDEAGAEATLVLAELGRRDWSDLRRRYLRASSGAWRAVGARAALGAPYAATRRLLFEDPDERVRRQALRAALVSHERGDREALLEAARLDPDPLSRSLATRAIGRLGSKRAVLALKDLYARADEASRLTILEAWASARSFENGGEQQLLRIAETDEGLPRVAAASLLLSSAGQGSGGATGRAMLVRAVSEGSDAERQLAIRRVPLDSESVRALRLASREADLSVSVPALARLLESRRDRAAALERLRHLGSGRSPEAWRARATLAASGDPSVGKSLGHELTTRQPARRQMAATGLVQLGELVAAAGALADDDPSVRVRVACAILSASE